MDDPLVGVTIWQSAQLNKKKQAREGFLSDLGVDGARTITSGRAGGHKSSGARRREARRVDKSTKRRETAGEDDNYLKKEVSQVNGLTDDLPGDDEEEELTESSILCREGGGGGGDQGQKTPPNTGDHAQFSSPVPQPQNFWLRRLFESKLFNMSIAIGYFFKSKEADVQAYLGNKLFVSVYV